MAYEDVTLHQNKAEHRFELTIEGSTSFIDYRRKGNIIYLIHTETPPEAEGKGIASALVEKTLRYTDEHHFKIVPLCRFVQSYLQKHPEWNRLLTEETD